MSKFFEILQKANQIGGKSTREALEYLASHKTPTHLLDKIKPNQLIKEVELGSGAGKIDEFFTRMIGNSAASLSEFTKNISSTKPLTENVVNLGKNFGDVVSKEIKAVKYRSVSPKDVTLRDGKVQGKGLFKHFKTFDREIVGDTTAGNYIIKTRKGIRPLLYTATPAGFGVQQVVFNKEEKNPIKRIGSGVAETVKWSLASPAASAQILVDTII